MLNELLIKDLSDKVDTNTSDIQDIKDAEVYSINEVKTNKIWIDGKPIYRKVINFGNLPNTTEKKVAHGLDTNICKIVNVSPIASNSSITISNGFNDEVYINGSNITWNTKSNRSTYTGYITLEYIKTTD